MLESRLNFIAAQIELELLRGGDLQFAVDQRDFGLRDGIGGEGESRFGHCSVEFRAPVVVGRGRMRSSNGDGLSVWTELLPAI